MTRKLTGAVVPRFKVSEKVKDHLFELWNTYYQNVDRKMFEEDIAEKDWVLTLSDEEGTIRGFTTLKFYELEIQNRTIHAIFNGSTIIARDWWGDQELVHTWCRFMAEMKREAPDTPLYWYLIVSGFRTYMFLPIFFKNFYPNHATTTPSIEQEVLDRLGELKFPGEYRDGIIHVKEPRECLDPEIAIPGEHKLRNPNIRFFVEKNAEYLRGDEMVCLTEFTVENTKRTANQIARHVLGTPDTRRFVIKGVAAS